MSRHAPVYVVCNSCGKRHPEPHKTIKEARAAARFDGWTLNGDTDTCGDCRPAVVKADQVVYWRNVCVLMLRDAANLNYRQIGEITKLSRQRIHQICQKPQTSNVCRLIESAREIFSAEISEPREQEPEEAAEGDDT